jgi:hypothetical protein
MAKRRGGFKKKREERRKKVRENFPKIYKVPKAQISMLD